MHSSALIMFVVVALAVPILSVPVAAPSEMVIFDREPEPITLGFPLHSGLPVPFSNQGLPLPASAQPTVSSAAPAPFFTRPPLEKERRQNSKGDGIIFGRSVSTSTLSPVEATTAPPQVIASFFSSLLIHSTQAVATNTPAPSILTSVPFFTRTAVDRATPEPSSA